MGQLEGKTAMITGGTSGIGSAIARRFVQEGAEVIITGRRDQTTIDGIAAALGPGVTGRMLDVGDATQVKELFASLVADGVLLDALVAAAGGGSFVSLADTTLDHYADTFDRNVRGTLLTVQSALPALRDGASILLLGSTTLHGAAPNFGAYAASKAAVRSFSRTWAAELVGRGIRVNTLTPGPTDTPGLAGLAPAGGKAELYKNLAAGVPMGRLADPAEIAAGALFLVSPESSYMTGAELILDGGETVA